jgi:hypothetical protein
VKPVLAVLVSVIAALAAPALARADVPGCDPQQEVAALDQYCESAPGAAPFGGGPMTVLDRPLGTVLPPSVVAQLRRGGTGPRALLSIAAAGPQVLYRSDPVAHRRMMRDARDVVRSGKLDGDPSLPARVISSVGDAASDPVGGAFRWAFVLSTLGLVGIAWAGYRRRGRL